MPEIPLHVLVTATRSHPPTAKVVPEWLVYEAMDAPEGEWCWVAEFGNFIDDASEPGDEWKKDNDEYVDSRVHEAASILTDYAARLIFEACLWRHNESGIPSKAISGLDGKWTACWYDSVTETDHTKEFGTDLAAALAFARGSPCRAESRRDEELHC